MQIFIQGFTDTFIENNIEFFLQLFTNIFETDITIGDIYDSDLLLVNNYDNNGLLENKIWKYTFLYSMGNALDESYTKYDCVLCQQKCYDKIVQFIDNNVEEMVKTIKNVLYKPYPNIQCIYNICNPDYEPVRFDRLNKMYLSMGVQSYNCVFHSPTYKHTITKEMIDTYVNNDLVKHQRNGIGMKKSEISLFLNYKAILEHIYNKYSDGLFLIFESDVIEITEDIKELYDFINEMYTKKEDWDLIHIGKDASNSNYFGKSYCEDPLPYRFNPNLPGIPDTFIEDISNPNDKYRLVRKFVTRCCDSFLWNYKGIVSFLNYMNENIYYNAPFDYYLTQFLETNLAFKHYWSLNTFFIQGSNYGVIPSTIQQDRD